jgi:hypothetical protein
MRSRLLPYLALGPLALAVLTACEDERAITREPVGDRAYGIRLLPSTFFNFPQGTASISPTNGTVTLNLRGLDSLTNGRYVAWVGNADGSSFSKLTGDLARVRTDTVRNALGDDVPESVTLPTLTDVSSWQDGNGATQYTFTADRASSGLGAGVEFSQVVVTVEESDAAASPNLDRAFLWARGSGALRYGNYALSADDEFRFPFVGRGNAQFRGDIVVINDSSIARPPRGYFFNAWLVRRDTLNRVIDYLDLGPMTTPYPSRQSLIDADVSIVDPAFVYDEPYAILAGAWRFDWANAPAEIRNADLGATRVPTENRNTSFAGFGEILITLEHKLGAAAIPSPHVLLRAPVPAVAAGL